MSRRLARERPFVNSRSDEPGVRLGYRTPENDRDDGHILTGRWDNDPNDRVWELDVSSSEDVQGYFVRCGGSYGLEQPRLLRCSNYLLRGRRPEQQTGEQGPR